MYIYNYILKYKLNIIIMIVFIILFNNLNDFFFILFYFDNK